MVPGDLTCLVRAAGSGDRLGQGPKAWVTLAGRPLLDWALRPLVDRVAEVIIAVRTEDVVRARGLLSSARDSSARDSSARISSARISSARISSARIRIIAGGASRWQTTRRLAEAAGTPWVMLHDTVHPLVSTRIVDDLMAAAELVGAAVPALPTVDFTWDSDAARITAPGRVSVVQTPVLLRLDVLRAGLAVLGTGADPVGPEGSILEVLRRVGQPWTFVEGDPRNIKVTWPADLALAAALVAAGDISGT